MNFEIIEGDCIEELTRFIDEGRKFDAVVMDPPYCSGGLSVCSRKRRGLQKYIKTARFLDESNSFNDSMDQFSYVFFLRTVYMLARNVLNPTGGGYVFTFIDWRQIQCVNNALQSSGLNVCGVIPWNKGNSRPNRGLFNQQCEFIVYATAYGKSSKFGRGYVQASPPAVVDRFHPTEKPVAAITPLLQILDEHSDGSPVEVFDPFCGSGSTGVAAYELGMNFTGIDSNPHFVELARKRLEAVYSGSGSGVTVRDIVAPDVVDCSELSENL